MQKERHVGWRVFNEHSKDKTRDARAITTERIKNFKEVPYGYSKEIAIEEANRCLQCKNKPCMKGCPVEIDIPGFVACIAKGDFDKAAEVIKAKNNLPAISGRVCPYETQCEGECTLKKLGEPLGIGRLERFIADYEREKGKKPPKKPESDREESRSGRFRSCRIDLCW